MASADNGLATWLQRVRAGSESPEGRAARAAPRPAPSPKRGAIFFLCLIAAALPAPVAVGAHFGGNTAAQDIAWFNEQRAANGIPAGISENLEWSADCDKHITYLQRSGGALRHDEDHSSPYYTPEGEWAGMHSVLARGWEWAADSNPWETAPIHLAQLMSPQLDEMGIADRDNYVCATTWPGMDRPLPDTNTVVTYPGDGTTTYASEDPAESPFTPEDIVGLSGETGPNLYVYEWGPALDDWNARISVESASLSGPDGDVPLKWVDHTTGKIGPYLPQGCGILMPVQPLKEGARYTASVSFSDGTSHQWSFTTRKTPTSGGGDGGSGRQTPSANAISIVFRHLGGQVSVLARSQAPIRTFTVSYHGRPLHVRTIPLPNVRIVPPTPLKHGTTVCVVSGGDASGYKLARACKTY